MIVGVADTHTALWHLFDDKRLSAAGEAFINEAATARRKIAIRGINEQPYHQSLFGYLILPACNSVQWCAAIVVNLASMAM